MAKQSTAAATDPTPTATPPGEPVEQKAEPVEQKTDVNVQFEELNKKLTEFQDLLAKSEQARKDSEAKALRNEAMYKGLQSQTTKTLQQAAANEYKLAQLQQDRAELSEIKEMLSVVAGRVLDEDERKELQYRQRELQLKLKEQAVEQAAQATQTAAQTTASTPYQSQEDVKVQFVNTYFPNSGVDPFDPNIDWGEGALSQQEALARFTGSVTRIILQKSDARTQDAMATIKTETDNALAAFKVQQAELLTTVKTEAEKAKQEAIDQARKDSEKKLRALGADVSGTPPSDGAGQSKTLMNMINEQLDDNMLRTPKGREEYNRRMEEIRRQFRGR